MTLSPFPGKIPETRKFFLIFCPSPIVAPKPTDQSRSNSVSTVPLQIYLARFFVFDLHSKLRVVHVRIFFFPKMAPTIFINFCGVTIHSNLSNMALLAFPCKILVSRMIFFKIFYLSRNVAPKPTEQSCSNSIFRVVLQLSPARPFHFRPILNIKDTLMLRVVHIRNKKRSDKHGILQA